VLIYIAIGAYFSFFDPNGKMVIGPYSTAHTPSKQAKHPTRLLVHIHHQNRRNDRQDYLYVNLGRVGDLLHDFIKLRTNMTQFLFYMKFDVDLR
jgi:hypothetical protein